MEHKCEQCGAIVCEFCGKATCEGEKIECLKKKIELLESQVRLLSGQVTTAYPFYPYPSVQPAISWSERIGEFSCDKTAFKSNIYIAPPEVQ